VSKAAAPVAPESRKPKGVEIGKVGDMEEEIDQLFDEFDDALDSVVLGKPGAASAAAPGADDKKVTAAPPIGAADDVFAEVDDFLQDPLAALEAEKEKAQKDGAS